MENFRELMNLSDFEMTWLRKAYELERQGKPAKYRELRILTINDFEGTDFRPNNVNRILYNEGKLSLLGVSVVNPDDPIFEKVDTVMAFFRSYLLESSEHAQLESDMILKRTGVTAEELTQIVNYLNDLGLLFSFQYDDNENISKIDVRSDSAFERILCFAGIEKVLTEAATNSLKEIDYSDLLCSSRDGLIMQSNYEHYLPNTAFIMMSINPHKPEQEDILNAIKEIFKVYDIIAIRADEIQHSDKITNTVLQKIRESEYLIADLTDQRPNVYYEVGYAHAIGKKPILVRKAGEQIHFDLSDYNVPHYRNATNLKEVLKKRLEAMTNKSHAEA